MPMLVGKWRIQGRKALSSIIAQLARDLHFRPIHTTGEGSLQDHNMSSVRRHGLHETLGEL